MADTNELLDLDVISLTSSDPADSALLAASSGEHEVNDEVEEMIVEPSRPACLVYVTLEHKSSHK